MNENSRAADGESIAPMEARKDGEASLGQRLAAARELRGWSRTDVASRLKLPASLIARLEGDDYAGLTDGVFLRGYLGSYARLVGIPAEQAASVAAAHTQAPPLVATGAISRSRYLFERYSVSATYLVLTAIIVVPAVWLATHGGLEQNLARTTPLDRPVAIAVPAHSGDAGDAGARDDHPQASVGTAAGSADAAAGARLPAQASPSIPVEQSPVIASMTPFPSGASTAPPAQPGADAALPASGGSGAHTLDLRLSQPSWVEVTTADGRKLEYATLAAGSEHSYHSDGALSFRIGNVRGAEVRMDGAILDLAPFQRGNVAHVRVFSESGAGASRIDQ